MMDSFNNATVGAIGWAGVHSLWQATLIFLLMHAARKVVGLSAPRARYAISCLALSVTLAAVIVTLVSRLNLDADLGVSLDRTAVVRAVEPAAAAAPTSKAWSDGLIIDRRGGLRYPAIAGLSWSDRLAQHIEPALPAVVTTWMVCLITWAAVQIVSFSNLTRLLKLSSPMPLSKQQAYHDLARRMGIGRPIRFLTADVGPFTIGWLKPVVFLPVSLATDLSAAEVESIVVHELAHVRRWDYLVNLLQIAVETLLFYHPCVWLMSAAIRNDRELCCDREAADFCGNPKLYATAIVKLADAEVRVSATTFAMAASGGSLLQRVEALAMRIRRDHVDLPSALASLLLSLLCVGMIGAAASEKASELRTRQAWAATLECRFVSQTLELRGDPANRFRDAYIDALRAASSRAPVSDPRYQALVVAVANGADLEVVWKTFRPLIGPTSYPTTANEFPSNWPFADMATHRRLVSMLWRSAKSATTDESRREASIAAIAVSAMRREENSAVTMRPILTDIHLDSVSGLGPAKVTELRRYWSAAYDSVGIAVSALQNRSTFADRSIDEALAACGERLPSLRFVVDYRRHEGARSGQDASAMPVVVETVTGPAAASLQSPRTAPGN